MRKVQVELFQRFGLAEHDKYIAFLHHVLVCEVEDKLFRAFYSEYGHMEPSAQRQFFYGLVGELFRGFYAYYVYEVR